MSRELRISRTNELGDADKQRNGKLHNGEGGSGEIVEVEKIGK